MNFSLNNKSKKVTLDGTESLVIADAPNGDRGKFTTVADMAAQMGAVDLATAAATAESKDVARALTTSNNLAAKVAVGTPATAGAAGTAGTIKMDGSYIYVCVATNTWLRAAVATW